MKNDSYLIFAVVAFNYAALMLTVNVLMGGLWWIDVGWVIILVFATNLARTCVEIARLDARIERLRRSSPTEEEIMNLLTNQTD